MKVGFCTYDAPGFTGGPNSWLRRLLPSLRVAGIEVWVLFFIDSNELENCSCVQDLSKQGIKCDFFPWQTTTEQKIHWLLSKLAEDPPDVFVPNMLVSAFYASRWVREAGIPTIGILHSDDEFYWGILKEFVFSRASYRLSALVCVSQFLTQKVISLGNTSDLIRQIPYGVSLPKQVARPPLERMRLIYVGRLVEEQKQISQVTSALCRAVREVPNTEAVIFGDGPAKANVEKILAEQGKGLSIKFAGLVDNSQIQEKMLESHVLVLLSDYEGLPIALMEAMACGLVPICLQIQSGIPELVEDEFTGLLVNDRNHEFIAAVQRLRNEVGLWERLSISARAKIEASYSNEVCITRWVSLLSEINSKTQSRKAIRKPCWLALPSVNSALAREDRRQPRFAMRILGKIRRIVSNLKRRTIVNRR
ncbi:MAG: glycosyltransferase family 4 protein [Aulosira sp. ZfuVER01]|nr:glycosyltransferase family 4 protein [Aulosira sp. ZfuVER01]MDZ8000770.1 glycosyltransferase family 4 protein [Aulosira sp. DedVER01a]MDZ8055079.1 glycosyltransferase family 4 protein [Aulosira sp. ZfuCHP01]